MFIHFNESKETTYYFKLRHILAFNSHSQKKNMDHIEIKSLKELGDELKKDLTLLQKTKIAHREFLLISQTRCPDQWFSAFQFNINLCICRNGEKLNSLYH
jgi:hypothetical protein